jgi:hypothetical protein
MSEKEMLLRKINTMDFAMYELKLFLDTHPNDADALALRDKYAKRRDVLVAEYEQKYGPLNMSTVTGATMWKWIADPWPWEYTGEAQSNVGV